MKAAVITGGHGFDVVGFHDAFRSLDGIDSYVQPLEDRSGDLARCGQRTTRSCSTTCSQWLGRRRAGGQRRREAIDGLGAWDSEMPSLAALAAVVLNSPPQPAAA